jgi:hypothetical protein
VLAGSQAEIYQTTYEYGTTFFAKIVDRSRKKLTNGSNFEKELSHGDVKNEHRRGTSQVKAVSGSD